MVTIERILKKIDLILKEKGEIKKGETYYPPVSIGGDFIGSYTSREYKVNGIKISDFKEVFNDKSGHHNYYVYHKRKIFPLIYKSCLVMDISLDLESKKMKINYLENGGWENMIGDMIK